jgi:hypothetical protein
MCTKYKILAHKYTTFSNSYTNELKLNKNLSLTVTFLVQRLKEPLYMEMEKKKQEFNKK